MFSAATCTVNNLYLVYKHALLNYNTDIASVMFAKPVAVIIYLSSFLACASTVLNPVCLSYFVLYTAGGV